MIVLEIIGMIITIILSTVAVIILSAIVVVLVPLAILMVVGAIAGAIFGIGLYVLLVMFLVELYRDSRREIKKLPRDIII